MNEVKSISINSKARVAKTILDFHVTGSTGGTMKKDRIQNGMIRGSMDQELDLVVGRSIN